MVVNRFKGKCVSLHVLVQWNFSYMLLFIEGGVLVYMYDRVPCDVTKVLILIFDYSLFLFKSNNA